MIPEDKAIREAAKIVTDIDKKIVFIFERNNEGASFQELC